MIQGDHPTKHFADMEEKAETNKFLRQDAGAKSRGRSQYFHALGIFA